MAAAAAAAARSGVTRLSHRLMRQLAAAKDGSNLVFSPLCIYSALSLLATGARGSTRSELVDALGATSSRCREAGLADMLHHVLAGGGPLPGDLHTSYACGLWHDASRTKVKTAYRDATGIYYMALNGALDFLTSPEEAITAINTWVEAVTGGFLPDYPSIVPPGSVDKDTRLVHTSAFSLEGFWETPFHRWRSKHCKFHRLDDGRAAAAADDDGDTIFMHSYEDQFVATHQGFKVLRMPYMLQLHDDDHHSRILRRCLAGPTPTTRARRPRYSMCIFLPDARDGLWSLEEQIASGPPGFLHEHLPRRRVNVGEFRLPKFRVSLSGCSLKQALQSLGIRAVFGAGADMSGMLDDYDPAAGEPIYVSDMLHLAAIAVDEEGTEAADPSPCTLCNSCLWPEESGRRRRPGCVDFVADHPFLFFVLEEVTGAILLAGHVLHPTQG